MNNFEKREFCKIVDCFMQEYEKLYLECEEYKTKLDIISDLVNIEEEEDLYSYEREQDKREFIYDKPIWDVRNLVLFDIIRTNMKNELFFQEQFKKNIGKLIPNGKIIKRKTIGGNFPDAWVEVNGEQIPVEVKKRDFNKAALKQLQRYIDVYGTQRGIAVAESLKVDLPKNIIFISHNDVKEKEG